MSMRGKNNAISWEYELDTINSSSSSHFHSPIGCTLERPNVTLSMWTKRRRQEEKRIRASSHPRVAKSLRHVTDCANRISHSAGEVRILRLDAWRTRCVHVVPLRALPTIKMGFFILCSLQPGYSTSSSANPMLFQTITNGKKNRAKRSNSARRAPIQKGKFRTKPSLYTEVHQIPTKRASEDAVERNIPCFFFNAGTKFKTQASKKMWRMKTDKSNSKGKRRNAKMHVSSYHHRHLLKCTTSS